MAIHGDHQPGRYSFAALVSLGVLRAELLAQWPRTGRSALTGHLCRRKTAAGARSHQTRTLLSCKRWPREGWHMNWPVAAVLIAVVFAIMVIVSTYVARPKR
jgi:hypothetical protein